MPLRSFIHALKPAAPSTATREVYPKVDGWYDQNSDGRERRLAFAADVDDQIAALHATLGQVVIACQFLGFDPDAVELGDAIAALGYDPPDVDGGTL